MLKIPFIFLCVSFPVLLLLQLKASHLVECSKFYVQIRLRSVCFHSILINDCTKKKFFHTTKMFGTIVNLLVLFSYSSNLETRKEFGPATMYQIHIATKMYTTVIDGKAVFSIFTLISFFAVNRVQ